MMMFLWLACAEPTPDDNAAGDPSDLTVTLAPPEEGYQLVTPVFTVPPYEEVEICTVIMATPKADEVLGWFDRVEIQSSEGSHHMNVMVGSMSFLDAFAGDGASEAALGLEQGQYPCAELDYMASLFPVFPSQRDFQEVTLPDGVAAPLLVPALMVFSHHYVNPTDATLQINAAINFHTVPAESVEEVATLIFDSIDDLELPPDSRWSATRTCVMERDVDLALVSTHTHQRAECATLNRYDGLTVEPEPFFVNQEWETPPLLHFSPGELSLKAGEGVHYACHYGNPTDQVIINDGTADGEMCIFAGVAYPSTLTVTDIERIVQSGDVAKLAGLMGEVFGPCDTHIEANTPWPTETAGLSGSEAVCSGMEQTTSNENP